MIQKLEPIHYAPNNMKRYFTKESSFNKKENKENSFDKILNCEISKLKNIERNE